MGAQKAAATLPEGTWSENVKPAPFGNEFARLLGECTMLFATAFRRLAIAAAIAEASVQPDP